METASSSSCHRAGDDPIDPNNFGNFHNIPAKIQAREEMIRGNWPGRGCEYCRNVENANGVSDRIMTMERHHGLDKIPPELLDNPTATEVTPTILEVYFNNTCNLNCVYCGPTWSSKWNDEIRKFGDIKIENFQQNLHVSDNNRYEQMVNGLWQYLEENQRYKIIRHYHILGGESLLQKELDQSVDFWQAHPNPSLTINLITNLMLPHNQFVKKMQQFESLVQQQAIYMLELTASLDCWGPQSEYIRHGLVLDTWQKNFEYMIDKTWCKLAVHSCITSLTIKTMPELIDKINYWNTLRPTDQEIEHNFDLVIGKKQLINGMHPVNFGHGVFDQDFDKIIELMPQDTEKQRTNRDQMIGQSKFITRSSCRPERIAILQAYLDEMDRRRNTNWRELFPWLNKNWI
jgi:hypothetical protein